MERDATANHAITIGPDVSDPLLRGGRDRAGAVLAVMCTHLLAALCLLLPSLAWAGEGALREALVELAGFDAGDIRDMGEDPLVSKLDVAERLLFIRSLTR